MSLRHSPQIVTDGLIFYYDANNTKKSWKGKPTVNIIETDLTLYSADNGCTVELLTTKFENLPIYRVTFPAGTLPRIRTVFSYTAGQQFTGSIYYKVVSQGSHTPQLIFRENGFGTTYVGTSLTSQTWTRANITYTFGSSGTSMFLLYQSNSGSTTPTIIDFAMPQTELGSFATPFVNGIRSNTESVIDLISNNTLTTNLAYSGDNTFSFNNSEYIVLNNSIDCYNKSYSIEAWVNRNNTDVTHGIIGDVQFGWFSFYINSNNNLFLQHGYYNPGELRNSVTGSTSLIANIWYHVVGVYQLNVGLKLYVNGILNASNSNGFAFALSETSRGPRYVGRADTSSFNTVPNYFNGKIDSLKGYSGKALTEAEVKQNFNATRSIYGV